MADSQVNIKFETIIGGRGFSFLSASTLHDFITEEVACRENGLTYSAADLTKMIDELHHRALIEVKLQLDITADLLHKMNPTESELDKAFALVRRYHFTGEELSAALASIGRENNVEVAAG